MGYPKGLPKGKAALDAAQRVLNSMASDPAARAKFIQAAKKAYPDVTTQEAILAHASDSGIQYGSGGGSPSPGTSGNKRTGGGSQAPSDVDDINSAFAEGAEGEAEPGDAASAAPPPSGSGGKKQTTRASGGRGGRSSGGGVPDALKGRRLPSKERMIGQLNASGKYTQQEIDAMRKRPLKDIALEWVNYVDNDPSSRSMPNPPRGNAGASGGASGGGSGAGAAGNTGNTGNAGASGTTAQGGSRRGRGASGSGSGSGGRSGRGTGRGRSGGGSGASGQGAGGSGASGGSGSGGGTPPPGNNNNASGGGAGGGGNQQNNNSGNAGGNQSNNNQGQGNSGTGTTPPPDKWQQSGTVKPWDAYLTEWAWKHRRGLATGVPTAAAVIGGPMWYFSDGDDQENKGAAQGVPSAMGMPISPDYMQQYQRFWNGGGQQMQQGAPTNRDLMQPMPLDDSDGPDGGMPEPPPQTVPASTGAPPQTTDIIRQLIQRGYA